MGENKWPHLNQILKNSDSGDTIPSNLQWGKWMHYFEHDGFQNRGSIHTHGFAYTEKKIHHCDQRCRPEGYENKQCSKGFPQPLSKTTHCSPNSLCYIYQRTKPEDRMVVPYHPETLLFWKAHINFQYVTSTGFAKYITKYVTKSEPSELFDIDEKDEYRKHVMARRLGAMELVVLLLQYPITRCSISIQYFPSAPSKYRTRSVKPIHLLQNENNDDGSEEKEEEAPYWDDAIDKYFDRPEHMPFKTEKFITCQRFED
nr:10458_t:CDS:2 [Entrophospora candida]